MRRARGAFEMARKVIQIALDSHPQAHSPLHALCDDGSIWFLDWADPSGAQRDEPQWERVPDVPADDAALAKAGAR